VIVCRLQPRGKKFDELNYLPMPPITREIFTEMKVTRVARSGDGKHWCVYVRPLGLQRDVFDAPELFIEAETVMLAAGTLGSTEILLRSRSAQLEFSALLGSISRQRRCARVCIQCDAPMHGVGFGDRAATIASPSPVHYQRDRRARTSDAERRHGDRRGLAARRIGELLPLAFDSVAKLTGTDTMLVFSMRCAKNFGSGRAVSAAPQGRDGEYANVLVMSHDDAAGTLQLDNDRVRIDWPNVGEQRCSSASRRKCKKPLPHSAAPTCRIRSGTSGSATR